MERPALQLASGALVPRRWAAGTFAGVALVAVFARVPMLFVGAVIILATLAVVPGRRSSRAWFSDLLAWTPIGAAVALSVGLALVITSSAANVSLWGSERGRVTLAVPVLVLGVVGVARGGRVRLWSLPSVAGWLPAGVLAILGIGPLREPMSYWSRPVWDSTDWMNHAAMTVDLFRIGRLGYAAEALSGVGGDVSYPRGLHALLAWVVAGTTSARDVATAWEPVVAAVVLTVALATVLAFAAAGLLSVAISRRLAAPRWVVVAAPWATAAVLLSPGVFDFLARAGFMTSSVGVVILLAAVLLSDSGPRQSGYAFRLVLSILLLCLTFYVWQLLVVGVLPVTAYLAWHWWTAGHRRAIVVVLVGLAAAVGCLPLAVATLRADGLRQASVGAAIQPAPTVVLVGVIVVAGAAVVVLHRRLGPLSSVLLAALTTLTIVAMAMQLAQRGGLELHYYPSKLLWLAAVLAVPVAVAGVLFAAHCLVSSSWLTRITNGHRYQRWLVATGLATIALAYVGGWIIDGDVGSIRSVVTASGQSPQVAMIVIAEASSHSVEGRPVLPYQLHPQGWPILAPYTDWHAAEILATLGADVPPATTLLDRRGRSTCDWLRTNPDALRLTGPLRGYEELMARGCPADVVRPDQWRVLTTPKEWWKDTPWATTGGEEISTPRG